MKRVSRHGSLLVLAALSSLALAGCGQEGDPDAPDGAVVQPTMNTITIDGTDRLRWNDAEITLDELADLLEPQFGLCWHLPCLFE
ncbi:MAG: lipoprotein, partial [Pseudomonadota bacterium]